MAKKSRSSVGRSIPRSGRPGRTVLKTPSASPLAFQPAPKQARRPVLSLSKALALDRASTHNANKKHHKQVQANIAAAPNEKHRAHSALAISKTNEPDKNQSSERARELKCKNRPDSRKAAHTSKGSGGMVKKFVPWCK